MLSPSFDELYDQNTDLSVILKDLSIPLQPYDIDDILMIHGKNNTTDTSLSFPHYKWLTSIGYSNILNALDKLGARDTINSIVSLSTTYDCAEITPESTLKTLSLIINHNFTSITDIIRQYAEKKCYVVFNGRISHKDYTRRDCEESNSGNTNNEGRLRLISAINNGMSVTKLEYHECGSTITNISSRIHNKSFSDSIRELNIYGRCTNNYTDIQFCKNVTLLNIGNDACIHKKILFPATLRVLNTSRSYSYTLERDYYTAKEYDQICMQTCVSLEELNADNNPNITSCEPFAQSLRKLSAQGLCGISDNGLSTCNRITDLNIWDNRRITIRGPYITSLVRLKTNNINNISIIKSKFVKKMILITK